MTDQAPATLPADFFDKQGAAPPTPPPATLPADFFDKQPQAAAPKTPAAAATPNPSENSFIEQYKQNSMLRVAHDLLGAASRDPETMQRAKETAAQLWQGISGEPARVKNEFLAFWNQAQQGHFEGDPQAAIPHLLRSVPFLGPLTEQIAQKIAAGQYAGAAGQFAAGAIEPVLIPKLAGAAAEVGANARDIPAMAGGAASGAWEGMTGPGSFKVKIGSVPVEIPGPRGLTRAAGGGYLGYKLGGAQGAAIGATVGAAAPLFRGAYRGALNALEEARAARSMAEFEAQARLFDQMQRAAKGPPDVNYVPPARQIPQQGETIITEAPADTSSVTAVPAEYAQREPLPPSRQLPPGRQIYEMPAAADTSGIIRPVPGEAPAATAAYARAPVVNEPPVAAPAATAEVSATAEDLRSAMGLKAGEMEAPAAAPEDTAAAAIARQRNANALIKAISPAGVSSDVVANVTPELWAKIAELAKLPPPDAATIETVLKTVAAKEGRPAPSTPRIEEPAAAAAPVTEPAPEPEPPSANPAEALATEMPGYKPPAPKEGPAPPTAAESRIEQIAKAVAADQRIPLHIIEDPEFYPTFFEKVAQQMKLNRPAAGEPEAILARVRELRGGTAEPPPPAAAPLADQVQARFDQEKAATIEPNAQGSSTAGPATGKPAGSSRPAVSRPRTPAASPVSGAPATVRVPGESTTYKGQYAVREIDDVHASHNAHTFDKNPDYHYRNDRDYSDPTNKERVVVNSLPEVFDPAYPLSDSPDATHGAPVIDAEGNVLGGNSRAMILDRVYQHNPAGAAAYRAELAKRAAQFGIDPAQLAKMKRPVLVREIQDADLANPQRVITDLNKKGTADLTAAERATADARTMSPAAADYLAGQIDAHGADATLSEVLSGRAGSAIVNKLVNDGVFTMQEKPQLIDAKTGAVTAAAKERISKMLLGQVFEDSDQMTRTPADIRNKLERVVSPVLQAGQKEGFAILPALRESINLLEEARAHGVENMADVIAQQGMFSAGPEYSAEAVQLAQFLKDAKPTEISRAFRRYLVNAEPTMYGSLSPAEAFADAFEKPASKPKTGTR